MAVLGAWWAALVTRDEAFHLVSEAREHSECLAAQGALRWTSASPDCPTHMWLAALTEELGEVARAIHDGDDEGLKRELADLAGVAVGRLESME